MPGPPHRRRSLLLSTVIGALSALLLAAPAAADHPEPEPLHYYLYTQSDSPCLYFGISGQLQWAATHPPEPSTVAVTGTVGMFVIDAAPGESCDPVVGTPATQVEYTFFGAGVELGTRIETFGHDDLDPIEFAFSSETEIDTVSIAACSPRNPDGSTWPGRCEEPEVIDDVPPPPYCEYTYSAHQWDGGFTAELAITPLQLASTAWSGYVNPLGDARITNAWNVDWSENGQYLRLESTGWNSELAVGETAAVGFAGTGEAPPPSAVDIYMNGRTCDDVTAPA